ncbi:UDP-N-acetylglucosamine 2-epimerase (non-hydrolyzing) [Thermus sp. SYSU G05001]|uniref:UDP-N-acetylglucosamine 2-epimerase (Non-hydrolyzing) n=1 Tax=Thermus brevis TaxID=2862456 RepID=A0ABS6ZWY3_9DEIN|nr:UDP-N-acetylglucosamine 2-epimerase (non-hydrolyzing) [Thermus brevis]MBW6394561.1 UDP-N-acetylglucosamine 2-epimerase (non-hydrolyzing) [Thermus brevis]
MRKILTVVGARPQFIKAAAVSRVLRAIPAVREVLVHTGQHYDDNMSRVFFEELEIPEPDYHLGIGGGTHGQNTGRMLEAIERVLLGERPDWVLVYGDTDSTLAGALAAAKLHIPVAHVEAGLRSFNRRMPEEINRVLTDHISDLLFGPTETAVQNLLREGISPDRIHLVGDVMYDAALYYGEKAEKHSQILRRLGLVPKGYILATVHRAENTDDPSRLRVILEALAQVHREVPVVIPVHPRTRKRVEALGLLSLLEQLLAVEPVGYLDMVMLEKNAQLIATDSGGVQKEAFFYEVPCITLREETEWVELVELGWNKLCSPERGVEGIVAMIRHSLGTRGRPARLYGEGKAAIRVRNRLLDL